MNRYAPRYIGTAGQSDELTPELARSKAALIWQMTRLGLNVPPAFVLPTELCAPVNRNDPQALAALDQGLRDGIARLQEATGHRLGGDRARLLATFRRKKQVFGDGTRGVAGAA